VKGKGRLLQAVAGIAISALALWLTLRGKNLGDVWQATLRADYRYLLVYPLFWAVIHLSRTWRWGILLEPVAKVPFGKLNAASCVGWMALIIMPFRLGEVARPYLVAERPHLRVSAALSSVVVERVSDGLFTTLLLMACLLAVPAGSPGFRVVRAGGFIMGAVFLGALAFLLIAYWNRQAAARFLERCLSPISPRLAARAASMTEAFIQGLRIVPSRGKVLLFFVLTVVYWGFNGWGMQVLAEGFGLHLDFVQATTLLGVLVIGVMIPAGPGMIGTFQAAILLALGLFFPRETVAANGMAYANVLWAVQLVLQVGLGLVFLFSRHISIGQLLPAPGAMSHDLEEEASDEGRAASARQELPPRAGLTPGGRD
jgi:glycosyltransferase 2 family protein